ncbi:MAG: Bro-N domain-containing protein [Nanoarchaeota archaeon]|nr:Bro-N domain-containing protein [Nanoarchaeota archaeon]
MNQNNALIVFQDKKIRRIWFNDEWWFSAVDIIEALTESKRSRKYWSDLKKRLTEEGFELSAKIGQLRLISSDGKSYLTDCANTKNMFRIIQSITRTACETAVFQATFFIIYFYCQPILSSTSPSLSRFSPIPAQSPSFIESSISS